MRTLNLSRSAWAWIAHWYPIVLYYQLLCRNFMDIAHCTCVCVLGCLLGTHWFFQSYTIAEMHWIDFPFADWWVFSSASSGTHSDQLNLCDHQMMWMKSFNSNFQFTSEIQFNGRSFLLLLSLANFDFMFRVYLVLFIFFLRSFLLLYSSSLHYFPLYVSQVVFHFLKKLRWMYCKR